MHLSARASMQLSTHKQEKTEFLSCVLSLSLLKKRELYFFYLSRIKLLAYCYKRRWQVFLLNHYFLGISSKSWNNCQKQYRKTTTTFLSNSLKNLSFDRKERKNYLKQMVQALFRSCFKLKSSKLILMLKPQYSKKKMLEWTARSLHGHVKGMLPIYSHVTSPHCCGLWHVK